MIKIFVLSLILLIITGCSLGYSNRAIIQQDMEGYAIASCLTYQPSSYLEDQGDAWASVIVQRMKGGIEVLSDLSEAVRKEVEKGEMAVIRSEGVDTRDKELPILYCNEIIYKSSIQEAVRVSIERLQPHYK